MKKFLTVLGCMLGFCGIVTLCYFFGSVNYKIVMPEGNYYLVEIRQGEEKDNFESSIIENSDLYLKVLKGNKIESFSGETGFVQDGITYQCEVFGTALTVKNSEEVVYKGLFAEKLIVIGIEIVGEVDGEEITTYYEYCYELKQV